MSPSLDAGGAARGQRNRTPIEAAMWEVLWTSTLVVVLAEIGDKTQLLALVLAARFRKPLPIAAGIFAATLANHTAAAWLGALIAEWVSADWLGRLVAMSFAAMALWTLVPDKLDDDKDEPKENFGPFVTTLIAFFLIEIGDKTQVATSVLAARYAATWAVIAGTTLGMMIADLPVVWIGDRLAGKLPLRAIRFAAAGLFAVLAVLTWIGWE